MFVYISPGKLNVINWCPMWGPTELKINLGGKLVWSLLWTRHVTEAEAPEGGTSTGTTDMAGLPTWHVVDASGMAGSSTGLLWLVKHVAISRHLGVQ